jgi:guanyl-specific ribonuclease Sa
MIILGRDVNIIYTNLNTYGNAGSFEGDRSTWGFSDIPTYWSAIRSAAYKVGNSYSCQMAVTGSKTPVKTLLIPANFNAVYGKKYYIQVQVYIPTGSPYDNIGTLRLFYDSGWTFVAQSTWSITQAKSGWRTLELMIERTGATQNNAKVYIGIDDVTATNGASGNIYADEMYVREYEDIVVQCTLNIDVDNTTIVDESAPDTDDGSITVAITGGTAPFQYSKDGVNWQSSSQFTGLAPGVYTIQVRDSSTTQCTDSQAFSINSAAAAFSWTAVITDESVVGAEDGQIDITVTGTGGPFTYSKNGGTNYQSGNVFANLAPGNYLVVVKDASNNTQSLLITIAAGAVVFDKAWLSKNPIPFERYASANFAQTNYKVMIDVQVEEQAGTGQFVSVMKSAMPPDVPELNRLIQFNLRPAFRGVFTTTPPDHNEASLVKITDRAKLFKVLYGDIYGQMDEPASWTATPVQLAMLGGISKFQFPTIDYLNTYLPANAKFMTWSPLSKEVDYTQEDYLQFWVYDPNATSVKLKVKAFFDDASNTIATISTKTVIYGDLLQVPAGPLNSGAIGINPTKNMLYYELWLTDQNDVAISETRTYTISAFRPYRTRYYLFLNSLGAFEVLRTTGFSEESTDVSRSVSEIILPLDYEPLAGQFVAGEAYKQNSDKVSSGLFSGPDAQAWLEYMQDVAISSVLYDITDGPRVPLVNMTKKLTVRQNEDNKRFARFEFMRAYSDHSYTPTNV